MTDRTHFKALYLYIHLLILCHNKVIRCLYHFFLWWNLGLFFYLLFMKTDNYPFEMNTVLAFNSKMIFVFRGICLGVPVLMISDNNNVPCQCLCFCCRFCYRSFFLVGFFFARKFTLVTWHVSRGHMTWVVFQWKLTIYPSHYICINRGILYM